MIVAALKTILIGLAIAAFTYGCLLLDGGSFARNMFIKERMALRVLSFGSSAILVVIWYYLHDLRNRKRVRQELLSRQKVSTSESEL